MASRLKMLKVSLWRRLAREKTVREHIEKRISTAKEAHEALKSLYNAGTMAMKYYDLNKEVFRRAGVGAIHAERAKLVLKDLEEILSMLSKRPDRHLDEVADRRFLKMKIDDFVNGPGYLAKLLETEAGGVDVSDRKKIIEEISRMSGIPAEKIQPLVNEALKAELKKNLVILSLLNPDFSRLIGNEDLNRFIEEHHEKLRSFLGSYWGVLKRMTKR